MTILNIAGYRFVALSELPALRDELRSVCLDLGLKGTILISPEGINLMLAGVVSSVRSFMDALAQKDLFAGMHFHESFSDFLPFKRLKVKIRPEIITLREAGVNPAARRAKAVTPGEFRRWLDEKRPMTVLDTRNDFEVQMGAFEGAHNPDLAHFGAFPEAFAGVAKDQPVVMYCTGGVRCEKAALVMMDAGFSEVYQLEGGILGYFAAEGGAHYRGECFVFDQRVTVKAADFHKN